MKLIKVIEEQGSTWHIPEEQIVAIHEESGSIVLKDTLADGTRTIHAIREGIDEILGE